MITSGSFAKLLWPGLDSIYQTEYKEWPTEYTDLFDMESSTKAYEESIGFVGLGLFQNKPEARSVPYSDMQQGFLVRFIHAEYALGFIITRNMMDDNQYPEFGRTYSRALARSLQQTKEILGANVYNRAFNPLFVGGDGVSLLNAAHPNKSGGTWSNVLSIPSDLSEASLEQATIDISKWTDDKGLKMAFMAQSLHIPTDLQYEAERILNSPYRVGTANNDINAIKAMSKMPKGYKINHFFDDTDAWFIRTNVMDGMVWYNRRPDEFVSDNDFETEVAKFKATFRVSQGWKDPRGLIGSPGA